MFDTVIQVSTGAILREGRSLVSIARPVTCFTLLHSTLFQLNNSLLSFFFMI